ncbi:ribonuclease D [Candidatus Hydrogenosomobacter endosymbioticus]|uniref:3'-5' exonuclease n=1 Tax=Candidatus Hydrogenosomobacter endosymbioticus TaxID=2558174 RepID=A0ABM7V8G3_9PROT|nr:ribonuclease D [Candidatus Hydrogenosomobacter endosymbioticus]BDB96058.1 3'-5' exonuclease [Candidatus Hydrogenosomobacter endosymbioticus]
MRKVKTIKLYHSDLPDDLEFGDSVAVDTEAMGLAHYRDRLCLVQLTFGDGVCHLVQIDRNVQEAPRLRALLSNENIEKIFHFARFDVALLYKSMGILCKPVYCTRIASVLSRTYTERHSLRELCHELLGVDISKTERSSYWGAKFLTDAQKSYAANDVLYLHDLKEKLNEILKREERYELFLDVCRCIPVRSQLDAIGFSEDIFAHHK